MDKITAMNKPKAVVVFSGGQDSTTCLYWALSNGWDVHLVTFNYGQRHKREIEAACTIAQMAGLGNKHEIIHVGDGILTGTSPLVNSNSVLEQYADHQSLPGGIEKTFVPMRNQLFLTIAANRAVCHGASYVVTGVCQEDYGGYPDCRRVFINALQDAINLGTFDFAKGGDQGLPINIQTPLMNLSKAQTVHLAQSLPGCMKALAYSHTSYDGQYPPVGKDHATLLRAKGFEEAGVPDPLVVRAWKENLMQLPETENYNAVIVKEILLNIYPQEQL
jgi:7-cyano-7-deazaguanine synthase